MAWTTEITETFDGAAGPVPGMASDPMSGGVAQRNGTGQAVGAEGYRVGSVFTTEASSADMAVEVALVGSPDHEVWIRATNPPTDFDRVGLFGGPEIYVNGAYAGGYWGSTPSGATLRVEVDSSTDEYVVIVNGTERARAVAARAGGTGSNHGGFAIKSTTPVETATVDAEGAAPSTPSGTVAVTDTATIGATGARTSTGTAPLVDTTTVGTAGARSSSGTTSPTDTATVDTNGARTSSGAVDVTDRATLNPAGAGATPVGTVSIADAATITTTGARTAAGSAAVDDLALIATTGDAPTPDAATGAVQLTAADQVTAGGSRPSAGTVAVHDVATLAATAERAARGVLALLDLAALAVIGGEPDQRGRITGASSIDTIRTGTAHLVAATTGASSAPDTIREGTSTWQI